MLPEGRGKAPHCKVPAAGELSQKSAEFGSGPWFNFDGGQQRPLAGYFEDQLCVAVTAGVF